MKKKLLPILLLLLAGGAHALTPGHLVKSSSQTYITDSILRDNGTSVAIGTTPVAGSSLTVMGSVFIGTTTAAPTLGSYGTLLAIGSLANSPGILFQGPTQRWGIRADSSTMDFNEETAGLTAATLSTAGLFSPLSLSTPTGIFTTSAKVSDGGQFLLPRAASIRGTIVPTQEGAQVWDSIAHAVCSATGTVSTSWIAGVTGSTPCAH